MNWVERLDKRVIETTRRWAMPMSRLAIFVIYFWFGALKVFSPQSAASPMVTALLEKTMPSIDPLSFLIFFGIIEMLIGLIFIIPHLERLGILILGLHLIATILPLFVLPGLTWQSSFVPTLEGQYIIKNILTIALAIGILAHLRVNKI